MTLTPEQIDLLKRLQPLFREKMGEWQEGDEYFDTHNLDHGWVEAAMPEDFNANQFPNAIRIPKVIDWQNPERGLRGMLNTRTVIEIRNSKTIVKQNWGYSSIWDSRLDAPDPFTALLKALAEQEGV